MKRNNKCMHPCLCVHGCVLCGGFFFFSPGAGNTHIPRGLSPQRGCFPPVAFFFPLPLFLFSPPFFSLPPPPCAAALAGAALPPAVAEPGTAGLWGEGGCPGLRSLWWFLRLRCPFRTAVSARGSASSSYFGLVTCSRELIRL